MNRLKLLRLENNKSQSQLAKDFHVSLQTISNYENEKRDIPTDVIIKLSNYFNVSIDYLLGKSDIRSSINFDNIKFANNDGLSTEGLTERDIEELKAQIEWKRNYNKEKRDEKINKKI